MNYCPECGAKLKGEPKFCPECGARIVKSVKEKIEKSEEPIKEKAKGKEYIEREVERKSNWARVGWGSVIILFVFAIGEFIIAAYDNNAGLFVGGIIFSVFGVIALISVLSGKNEKSLEQYKQYQRDKIIRREELRDAQLQALNEGQKQVHLTGKIRKLK